MKVGTEKRSIIISILNINVIIGIIILILVIIITIIKHA